MKWCQFKFIIQMRKKANLLKSNRGRIRPTSINDLVTQSEQTMSSQASIYTNTSKPTRRNNSQIATASANSQEFDDYEDIIADDIDTLFITPEEERKIQSILQFARKGKINPGNAFEIPVRVIDPQLTEGSNMRFWKFASELLYASMSIYDKRVENMFLTTNRMFDNLIRVQGQNNQPLTEEENEEKQRKQRGELIQMDVGDIGKVQTLSSYEIGTVNCEDAERINIKNQHNQFLPDPLFHKRLQAFDSNTLKSLFLNAFETGTDLQVTFFNNDQQRTASGELKMSSSGEVKIEIEGKQEEDEKKEEQQEQIEEFQERVPRFIRAEIEKSTNNLPASSIFSEMSNFRKENIRDALQNNRFQVKDFVQELKLQQKDQYQSNGHTANPFLISEDATETNSTYSFQQGENEFNFQFNVSEHTQFSEQAQRGDADSLSMPNTFAHSQRQTTLAQFYLDDDEENHTQMTPWQLQFKGMTLQKRIRRNQDGKPRKARGSKTKTTQELEIDFMDGKKQTKAKIFPRAKTNQFSSSKNDEPDKNVQPRSMHVITDALKKRRNIEKPDSFYLHRQTMAPEVQPNNNKQSHEMGQNEQMGHEQAIPNMENYLNIQQNYPEATSQQTTNFSSNLAHQQHDSQGIVYRSTGIRNIRQIKQKIYKHIQEGQRVRLSQLNIRISPSSIMIVFLHLVNQNDIAITSVDNENDIEISPRMA